MSSLPPDSLERLRRRLAKFAADREWDPFHSPKNLAMALVGEAGELVEHFQWLSEGESRTLSAEKRQAVAHELADILIYLIRLADKLDVNLVQAVEEKILINESRYPCHKVRGSARRAEEYD